VRDKGQSLDEMKGFEIAKGWGEGLGRLRRDTVPMAVKYMSILSSVKIGKV